MALDPWEGLCSRGWDSSETIVPFNFLSELDKREQVNDRTCSFAVQVCELGPVLNVVHTQEHCGAALELSRAEVQCGMWAVPWIHHASM